MSSYIPKVPAYNPTPSYYEWKSQFAYVGRGTLEGTMEEAMIDFFHNGVSCWIKKCGYRWNTHDEHIIARKFTRFCYDVACTLRSNSDVLLPPQASHRDLPEDRMTFDIFVDTEAFIEFLNEWECRSEIIQTPLEYMIREFCYIWVDVTYGKPGRWTSADIDQSDDERTDDEHNVHTGESNNHVSYL